jgi:hypothetical protein
MTTTARMHRANRGLRQSVFSSGPMAFASQESLTAATAAYPRGDMGRL